MNYSKLKKKAWSCIILSVVFLITGIALIPVQNYLSFGLWYFLIMLCVITSIILFIVYMAKYRQPLKMASVLKNVDMSVLTDGIDINTPTYYEDKIFCGSNAFFCKKADLFIPYHLIKWVHRYKDDPRQAIFHLENGKSVIVQISNENLFKLINNYIVTRSPDVLVGDSADNQKKYYTEKRKATRKVTAKTIGGILTLMFGITLLTVGLIKNTMTIVGLIVILVILIASAALIVSEQKYFSLKEISTKVKIKARNSVVFTTICKISSVSYGASLVLFIVSGKTGSETLVYIFLAIFFISAIPFFLSIFLRCGFFQEKKSSLLLLPQEILDDTSFIVEIKEDNYDGCSKFTLFLTSGYGWKYMKETVNYLVKADIRDFLTIKTGDGTTVNDITKSFNSAKKNCHKTPELNTERGFITLLGLSTSLAKTVKIDFFNQTRVIQLSIDADKEIAERYIETVLRRSFDTEDTFKRAIPVKLKKNQSRPPSPIVLQGTSIHIDSDAFIKWISQNPQMPQFNYYGAVPLTEKEPTLYLYEDGLKTREYTLQTENDEDFTGKYFLISVRLGVLGNPAVPVAQIDGFISDTPEDREMTTKDIGYRIEGHFLACGGNESVRNYENIRGQDLNMKGLKYTGYTTPSNIRLVGICPECGKSFCFHGYAFYMTQCDVAYSDDGLDCCSVAAYDIDKNNWSFEAEGKTFRYYNSFNCPHCGTPYIDYKKYPENKVFGVSGCVHLGRKAYQTY